MFRVLNHQEPHLLFTDVYLVDSFLASNRLIDRHCLFTVKHCGLRCVLTCTSV